VFLLEIKCSDLALFSSSEFSLGGVAVVCVKKEQKFQTKPLKNIPEMAFFGWLSPASSLQAGRKAGRICLGSMDVGELRSKRTWKVWVDLGGEQLLGSRVEGKATSAWGPSESKSSETQWAKMPLKKSSNSFCLSG